VTRMQAVDSKSTGSVKTYLFGIFFLFGFSTMAWVPRFPEVKTHMHLTNGQFGSLISVGSIGGIISLLTVGHIVHRYGALKVMTTSSMIYLFSIGLIVHLTSITLFLICNALLGASIAAFNIAINAQTLQEQELTGETLIPKVAGLWSSGALLTILLSGFLTTRISLIRHIDILEGISFITMAYLLRKMRPHALKASESYDVIYSLKNIFRAFRIDWLISLGMLMGAQLEFSAGDWATIYARENLNLQAGIATLPYIAFMSAMILGRLTIHKFEGRVPMEKLVRLGGLIGGSSFIVGIALSNYFKQSSPTLSFLCVSLGFLIGGFGSSFLSPIFMNLGYCRSNSPAGVVVGQLGVMNNALTFLGKAVIALAAQWISLPVALLIPGIMLLAVSFFAHVTVTEAN
jgi:MFS family permease